MDKLEYSRAMAEVRALRAAERGDSADALQSKIDEQLKATNDKRRARAWRRLRGRK